jgi:hypothetical protein
LGVQVPPSPSRPHLLGPPPPQNSGAVQVPQSGMMPPQPSPAGPQFTPSSVHVLGTHPPPSMMMLLSSPPSPPPPSSPVSVEPELPQPSDAKTMEAKAK